jgi:hypothetical protein
MYPRGERQFTVLSVRLNIPFFLSLLSILNLTQGTTLRVTMLVNKGFTQKIVLTLWYAGYGRETLVLLALMKVNGRTAEHELIMHYDLTEKRAYYSLCQFRSSLSFLFEVKRLSLDANSNWTVFLLYILFLSSYSRQWDKKFCVTFRWPCRIFCLCMLQEYNIQPVDIELTLEFESSADTCTPHFDFHHNRHEIM